MDASEIWQENKKFIITVGSGLLVFLIGNMVVTSMYSGDIRRVTRDTAKASKRLKTEMYTADDLGVAEDENVELTKRYEQLRAAAEFQPRQEFTLDAYEGSAQNAQSSVREKVLDRIADLASRKRAFLPDGLDLEMLKTRNVDALERHIHALDMLERALVLALEAGVRQVRAIEIKLDPSFDSTRGVNPIEKTVVTVDVIAAPEAVTRWLAMAETPMAEASPEAPGLFAIRAQALPIREVDIRSNKSKKNDDVRARISFDVVRIHEIETDDEDEG